ncbi:WhiB family transcriptional regulator [Streptomyces sp. NPDC048340]|uniref:WhiB family transcriptional regulator n=1 Tax=Streptomyces sp. NPDC048340 TaxID=3365537 RepID=UPI00372359C1
MHYITTHEAPAIGLRGAGDHSWYDRALCYGMDIEEADQIFFPEASATEDIERAKMICGHCPVRQECFNAAMDTESRTGIRAGLTESERKKYHAKAAKRLDYQRIEAFFRGRDVALSATERDHVIRRAIRLEWSVERLGKLLRTTHDYTRRLMNDQRKEMAKEKENKRKKKAAKGRKAVLTHAEVVAAPGAPAPSLILDLRTAA